MPGWRVAKVDRIPRNHREAAGSVSHFCIAEKSSALPISSNVELHNEVRFLMNGYKQMLKEKLIWIGIRDALYR